jgi:hypothetical protein
MKPQIYPAPIFKCSAVNIRTFNLTHTISKIGAGLTQISTEKNCHCERPKGARQSHTKCHPELDSG